MRTARKFVLLAALGQLMCGAPTKPIAPDPPGCPKPVSKGPVKEKTFDLGKPPLPSGIACLRWPMGGLRKVSSNFMDPDHVFTPGRHDGTDIPAPIGTDVLAPAGGVVSWIREVAACQDAGVAVRFGEGWAFAVHHLSRVDVVEGETVVRGQRLGLSGGKVGAPGSGSWTTGPHLHFSLAHDGAYVDAERYFCP